MSEPMKNPPARKTQTAKRNYQKEMEKVLDAAVRDGRVPTLFLHSCCAPCSSYVLEYLSQYFSITVFYYNPNISPKEEYEARTEEVQRLIRELPAVHPIRFVEGKYDPECYYEAVRGHEKDPEGGYDWFTTTLTISPLKNAGRLNTIGQAMGEEYHVAFLPSDFKKKEGYKRSIELSAQYHLYRQNYCGCVFSKREREEQMQKERQETS